jgi:hypothetical protein
MSYQGVLTDAAGNLVPDGPYFFEFRIYNTNIVGPPPLWSECQTITVAKGGFNAILGSFTPLNLPFDVPYYLGFSVDVVPGCPVVTPELSPRVALAASPYSLSGPNGSGTANFVAKFTGPKTVGSSKISDDGIFVGINRTLSISANEVFGIRANVGADYGGMYIQTNDVAGRPFYGYNNLGGSTAWTYLDGNDSNKWKVYNSGDRLAVQQDGNVGIGTNTPTTNLEVAGGTKLGTGAPAIKMLKLTGMTAASQGGTATIPTGISPDKILSISVMVEYAASSYLGQAYTNNSGYQFNWYETGGSINVWNTAANSINILSKNIKILITYEE